MYYIDGHIKVLAASIDQETDLRSDGKKISKNIYNSSTEGSNCQGEGCNHKSQIDEEAAYYTYRGRF